jgi:ABC-type phosphate transport system substrate-binding protein
MMRSGIRHLVIVAMLVGLGLGSGLGRAAISDDYKIIVHPNNPISAVDRQFLRDAYLGKTSGWNTGGEIRPIDLATRFPVRDRFGQDVLKKTPSQLKNYWNQQIFSGKGVPPPEAASTDGVIAYVLAHPGAIGYLPLDADAGGTKLIKVK